MIMLYFHIFALVLPLNYCKSLVTRADQVSWQLLQTMAFFAVLPATIQWKHINITQRNGSSPMPSISLEFSPYLNFVNHGELK